MATLQDLWQRYLADTIEARAAALGSEWFQAGPDDSSSGGGPQGEWRLRTQPGPDDSSGPMYRTLTDAELGQLAPRPSPAEWLYNRGYISPELFRGTNWIPGTGLMDALNQWAPGVAPINDPNFGTVYKSPFFRTEAGPYHPANSYAIFNDQGVPQIHAGAYAQGNRTNSLAGILGVLGIATGAGAFGDFGLSSLFGGGAPVPDGTGTLADAFAAPSGVVGGTGAGSAFPVAAEALGSLATPGAISGGTLGAGAGIGGALSLADLAGPGQGTAPLLGPGGVPIEQAGAPVFDLGPALPPITATGTAGAAGTALSRILGGNAGTAEWLEVLGSGGAAALGLIGANRQSEALSEVANQFAARSAPSLARFESSFAPGFSIWDDAATRDAAARAADISARSYSARMGNPFDNPTAQAGIYGDVLSQVALPQLNAYRSQNLTGAGLGTNIAGTAGLAGAEAARSPFVTLAGALGDLTAPKSNLEALLKQLSQFGLTVGGARL